MTGVGIILRARVVGAQSAERSGHLRRLASVAHFAGFPVAALDFYDDLEADNTRSFWETHKEAYTDAVRRPMLALMADLQSEFGTAKVFRPYRDVRFGRDKTPLKEHQGAYVEVASGAGYYVQIAASGVRVGVGWYRADPLRLAAIRAAIDDERTGSDLVAVVATLEASGWERGGEQVKTSPRGYNVDHPRIDLLRHKSLSMGRSYGFSPEIHTPELLDWVRRDWRAGRPLIEWVASVAPE